MTKVGRIAVALLVLLLGSFASVRAAAVVWRADDARPIAEPAFDGAGDHVVRDGIWSMTVYEARKVVDPFVALPALGAALHVVPPREAADVNALDEVPDSTWFTNRHGLHRLTAAALARGPNRGRGLAATGPLTILSGKPAGMTPGFVVRDARGDRYVLKFDPPAYPEVPTGAEMVCTKILYALGWNVPENYLVRLDPRRFAIGAGAWMRDGAGKRPLTDDDVAGLLAGAARLGDGRLRAVASRWLPGTSKGGFRTLGVRPDDANDTVPHEDRRELRGLRVVAAWINYTDARRGNFLDTFVPDPTRADGRGHLVHYVLDFSSALGAGNDDWKPARYGHEYFFDPPKALMRVATLGLVRPAWSDVPLAHPALGYFDADTFAPEEWRTTYPNPLFDAATVRDAFWGAKLVSALDDADLAAVVRAGEWSDPRAADVLADLLRRRQRAIARTYFDWRHVNPIDGFAVDAPDAPDAIDAPDRRTVDRRGRLRFHDLAVENDVVAAAAARYRRRLPGGEWTVTASGAALDLGGLPATVELETSHDDGRTWSPATRVTLAPDPHGRVAVTAIDRDTR